MRMSFCDPSSGANVTEEYVEEGYLMKKRLPKESKNLVMHAMQSITNVMSTMVPIIPEAAQFDTRYFRLKKGKLYWYINDKS
jgi:hypothetical protein